MVLKHVQNLSLQRICLSENVIKEIIRTCPNISYFALKHFAGFKTVKISKLDKLESLSILNAQPKRPDLKALVLMRQSLNTLVLILLVKQIGLLISV